MQKKLIALAIASLSGAAFAQSNVTVYGLADATFDVINTSGPAGTTRGAPDYSRVQSNGSRLGFKGTENLGNGMSAFFQYETAVSLDNGAGGSLFASARDSFVGLKGEFGAVKLGYFSGPNRELASKLDVVIHSDGIGDNSALLGKLGGRGKYFDDRYANSIAYITPNFSGFEGTLQYQANEKKVVNSTNANGNPSLFELGLTYNNGPVFVGLTHGRLTVKNDVSYIDPDTSAAFKAFNMGNDEKATETRLGGMYTFGDASVRAIYTRTKGEGSKGDLKQNVWGLGGTYMVTPNGKLLAQYYHANDLSGSLTGTPDLSSTGAKFWVLGYEHSLSKRTTLLAHYAYVKNDDRTSTVAGGGKGFDFGDGKTGIAGNGVKLSGLSIGLNHTF
jgi:predicted porin